MRMLFGIIVATIALAAVTSAAFAQWEPLLTWESEGIDNNSKYGWALAGAGDVNGDGYADVLATAPDRDFDEELQFVGQVCLFYGSENGLSDEPDWEYFGDLANSTHGNAVAGAGDVNGDGYDDFLIAASQYNTVSFQEGKVLLFYGSATGPADEADWSGQSLKYNANFGHSVSGAGDVNGDGYDDVLLGAPIMPNGQGAGKGVVFAYYGSASGLSGSWGWREGMDDEDSRFGRSLAGVGDVNGDGYDDVVVGAPNWPDNTVAEVGRACLVYGSASGIDGTMDCFSPIKEKSSRFGESVAGVGDVNGDGFPDFLVGQPGDENVSNQTEHAYLYLGGQLDLGQTVDDRLVWTVEGEDTDISFGFCVAGAGDINGDGVDDFAIGAPDSDYHGKVVAFTGVAQAIDDDDDDTTDGDDDDTDPTPSPSDDDNDDADLEEDTSDSDSGGCCG